MVDFKLIDVMSRIPINELVVKNLTEWIYLIILIIEVLVLMLFIKIVKCGFGYFCNNAGTLRFSFF